MRILLVNKYLYPKGGSEQHLFGLAEAIALRGHELEFFGMQHPSNITPPERTVAVPETDYRRLTGVRSRVQALRRMLYCSTAHRALRRHLSRSRPDVAHLHNIYHQLSPSILPALRAAGVPCVLTAHDYKLVCPSYSLHDGRSECFACRGHRYWNVLARGCSRQGLGGDMALAVEALVHHFLRVYERHLDLIIAPSRFVRDRLVAGGFDQGQIRVLPNAIAIGDFQSRPDPGGYMLFVGRLSYEKGLPTLIEAARQLPDVPIWLAGDGPLGPQLRQSADSLPHVRFLGAQPHAAVRRLLEGCRALVLPSEVPENCPLSVLEAFASAKPAIATRVGGVPELFDAEVTGLVVPPGQADALAAAMRQLWNDPDLSWHCGTQARVRAERAHDLTAYVETIESIYRDLVSTGSPCGDSPWYRSAARSPGTQTNLVSSHT